MKVALNRKESEMPRGDRTGPEGFGPMTGRAAGFCAGNAQPGFVSGGMRSFGWGNGMAMGFRGGRGGRRRGFWGWAMPGFTGSRFQSEAGTGVNEKEYLKSQADMLSASLEQIKKRIEELESN